MRILRIVARLNVGGPARHVVLANAGLRARGHQTLLVHGELDAGEASLDRLAIVSGIPHVQQRHLGRRISPVGDLRAFTGLLGLMRREQPDVVHSHTAKAGTLGRLAARAYNSTRHRSARALVVHTFHGHVFDGYFSPVASRLVVGVERQLARITDRIVTISPSQERDIVGRYRVARADQTVVVPLGLDLDALLAMPADAPDLRARIGASPDDLIVGYAGRLVPVKDLPTLVRGFARMSGRTPRMRLVLAGDGPERGSLEQLARALGVEHRVHFLGWVDDLLALYATLDIFALSSVNEGTPVAVIEAMAAGRPVIAAAVGGVPDVVDDGGTGLLVPCGDADRFADALVRLASSEETRTQMGVAARLRARERYSHVRLVDDLERLYADGLGELRG